MREDYRNNKSCALKSFLKLYIAVTSVAVGILFVYRMFSTSLTSNMNNRNT